MRPFSFLLVLSVTAGVACSQMPSAICVQDGQGRPIAGATVTRAAPSADTVRAANTVRGADTPRATSGPDGCITLPSRAATSSPSVMIVSSNGFRPITFSPPQPGQRLVLTLQPGGVQQAVTVTADRGLVGVTDRATSIAVLDQTQMLAAPGLALDDRLHQAAGFQLFRRTSSWTANPTTEGVSLRGLGSTAASRTLVESDEVPLNDPFGGWIHWDEIPTLAIANVALVRGGSADLYGSSAIGGVIAEEPVTPSPDQRVRVVADALGATQDSAEGDLLLTASGRLGGLLLAGSGVDTGGYVPTAPQLRGLVDVPSNVAQESGRMEFRHGFGTGSGVPPQAAAARGDIFLRGNVLNEVRANGTVLQTNGTRLWRYVGGGDLDQGVNHVAFRLFGDRETYRQSFSSITADRNAEMLTRLQQVPSNEFGLSLTGARAFGHAVTGGVGLDLRDIRATDAESPVSQGAITSTTSISAHQRDLGGYAQAIWQAHAWSVAASVRVDSFRTFDGRQVTSSSPAVVHEPEVEELLANPHLGIVRQLPGGLALTANGFRAFRGPTMNELYRTGQVGQQTTRANPSLLAERATGFEVGGEFSNLRLRGKEWGHLRASYFWTEVNRPVSTVVLTQTATSQTLQRQNLGQIRSRGLTLEGGSQSWRGLDVSAGWQLAVATVTAFNAGSALQANLIGKWIPEVPRNMATATVNYRQPRVANLHLIASYTGRTYDDSANQFLLRPYARFDVSVDRELWRGLSLYAGAQNLLNRAIDAGRTPILTLASPRLVQAGLRWTLSR